MYKRIFMFIISRTQHPVKLRSKWANMLFANAGDKEWKEQLPPRYTLPLHPVKSGSTLKSKWNNVVNRLINTIKVCLHYARFRLLSRLINCTKCKVLLKSQTFLTPTWRNMSEGLSCFRTCLVNYGNNFKCQEC